MNNIAIFASGNGTNAEKIFQDLQNDSEIKVALVLTNNSKAGVISRAENLNIPVKVFSRTEFYQSNDVIDLLIKNEIQLIVLAGFLWLLPQNLIEEFPSRIINIHPALLPKYGGKGMYGMNVHNAVIAAKEQESGITIHFINEKYDEGEIILQEKCKILKDDSAEDLAKKVQQLEHEFYPKVIRHILK
ncbi:phosphoribosylglycinamide formyltransferase [soil metagenome]